MPEHQNIKQSKGTQSSQRQIIPAKQIHVSSPAAIIQRARIDPKSLTSTDVLQLQRTIGNRAVGRLLSEIRNSSTVQQVPVQRQEMPEEEEHLQMKKENNTGMPDILKAGLESLSGINMSDVRVHYNSSKPAEIGALAYTQGKDIHVAPGQEKHLPHEAWHVVQQKQGHVSPMGEVSGMPLNDSRTLESEADSMGWKALQQYAQVEKPKENKDREIFNSVAQKKSSGKQGFGLVDYRHQSIKQRTLQRMILENYVSQPITRNENNISGTSLVAQMVWNNMYKANYEKDYYYVKDIFDQRVKDGTATTGVHNYAYDFKTKQIMKSGTSAHAEILLLSMSRAVEGEEVILISEYKPCKYCRKQIENIEKARRISVRVIYLLDYEEKGDGDTEITRKFYERKKWLSGGGSYVYSVVKS